VQAGAYIKKEQASYIRANDGWGSTGSNGSAWGSGHRVCGSGSSGRPNGRCLGGREGKWTRGADSGAATNDVSPPPCTPVVCPPLTTPAQDAHSHKPYGSLCFVVDLRLPKRGTIFSAFIGKCSSLCEDLTPRRTRRRDPRSSAATRAQCHAVPSIARRCQEMPGGARQCQPVPGRRQKKRPTHESQRALSSSLARRANCHTSVCTGPVAHGSTGE
jgi:hypothetical protein